MKRLLYILLLASVCMSCRTQYVPIETVKHDSVYINRIKYASIYHKDSIYILIKGATVYKYQYKYQYRDKLIRDTVNVTKRDSIPYPVEVVKTVTVEKKLSWLQTTLIWTGGIFWVLAIVALIVWTNKRTSWIFGLFKLIKS